MRKWKAEIWMNDRPPRVAIPGEDTHLTEAEINIAMEAAKAAIEKEWDGLKVVDFDAYIDKEEDG